MNPLDLIHLQITLEYQLDPTGLLIPFEGSTEQAKMIAYRHAGGFVRYFRHDLPTEFRTRLAALEPALAFVQPERFRRILEENAPCPSSGLFESLYFAKLPSPASFPEAQQENDQFIVKVDGQPIAWAWSERQNDRCAELAVETRPFFQRRGYARQVSAAWANHVMSQGQVAFYSYKAENIPSSKLAQSLGVVWYATCAAFD